MILLKGQLRVAIPHVTSDDAVKLASCVIDEICEEIRCLRQQAGFSNRRQTFAFVKEK